jgi:hypothetical protein
MTKHFDQLTLSLTAPDGTNVDLSSLAHPGSWPVNDDGSVEIAAHNYRIPNPQLGSYAVRVELVDSVLRATPGAHTAGQAIGLFVATYASPVSIVSYLNTYELEVGRSVGLVTRVADDVAWTRASAQPPAALPSGTIDVAYMVVVDPNGVQTDYVMHDDGLHDDELANDGIYGATFIPSTAGRYVWFAHVFGTNQGVRFQRTTEHLVRVASVDAELTGKATLSSSGGRVTASIGVQSTSTKTTSSEPLLSIYAELWTVAGTAIGWAATAATPSNGLVTLSWDARWFADAGVRGGEQLELRNVYISEMDGFVPLSVLATIAPKHRRSLDVDAAVAVAAARHSDEKMFGERPAWLTAQLTKANSKPPTASNAPLVLVHGYCAGSNPFLATPTAWTDYHTFGDFGKSRTNDEFARLIGDFAKNKGLDSGFAGVGHSQGGIALTHLMCTYWSGMDTTRLVAQASRNATTGTLGSGTRVVQSVGTPYKGCSGAGAGASLIKIFGVGCGSNDDLTPDGAALWLSTISQACAADVYYYTTTYKLKGGSWLGEWCNLATSMVLEAPNDGTTELVFADLPGGHNMGNVESECHTTDMVYPPQTDDAKRNVELNANAGGRV